MADHDGIDVRISGFFTIARLLETKLGTCCTKQWVKPLWQEISGQPLEVQAPVWSAEETGAFSGETTPGSWRRNISNVKVKQPQAAQPHLTL